VLLIWSTRPLGLAYNKAKSGLDACSGFYLVTGSFCSKQAAAGKRGKGRREISGPKEGGEKD
jgi:hypothetical protein